MTQPHSRFRRFVDALLENRRPRRFRPSRDELDAMRAAIRLRAARTGADLPDPAFVDRLGRQLREKLSGEPAVAQVSRRRLLAAAGSAAAAAVAGGIAGVVGDRLAAGTGGSRELVPNGARWQAVVAASAVADQQAVRFSTGAVEGFVVKSGGHFRALSAVCTHRGCLLQDAHERLACPCHRTTFSLDGTVTSHELPQPPPALPTLRTRLRDGQVEVFTA